ncbi:MAG TPA: chemotaxis protein CheW [Steroidobacteraceae bacterium]|nr:chemotaxis protein CheW [Steroidobacteraceae bacterium]
MTPAAVSTTAELPIARRAETGSGETGTAQYLTFTCANEEYGVDILRVQEIRGWAAVTKLPESPRDVMGVLNLRGQIVPVFDLRTRFGLETKPIDASTVVIVLRLQASAGDRIVGICVDGVSDVQNVATDTIMATPDVGGRADDQDCVSGLATVAGKTLILLDIDRLF